MRPVQGPCAPATALGGVSSLGHAPNRFLVHLRCLLAACPFGVGCCVGKAPWEPAGGVGSSCRPWSPGPLTSLGPPAANTLGTGGSLKVQVLGVLSLVLLGTGGHPGQPGHSRDLTVTRLRGELPNLALTRPLPSTSSENLRESARVSRGSGPGSRGRQLRQAPGGLGWHRGGTGVIEQAQLGQACGGRAGSQCLLGESVSVPSSVGAVPRGCGRAEEAVAMWAGLGFPVPG